MTVVGVEQVVPEYWMGSEDGGEVQRRQKTAVHASELGLPLHHRHWLMGTALWLKVRRRHAAKLINAANTHLSRHFHAGA